LPRYFSPSDIAHQALLAAISITVSLNDGARQDKILYVPMVTMTSRTTLLSKTIQIVERLESDRNANIVSANMVITSPSVDLKPRHLPLLMAFIQSRTKRHQSPSSRRANIISRLLPKASIKFSIQEPAMRIVLPPTEHVLQDSGDMDMLISSLSSISVDLEASHEAEGQSRYSLTTAFRITSHHLYYRAASGIHHDLLQTETFDLKAQLNATQEVQVVANAYLSSFSLQLVRPEIVQGIKQMVAQFHGDSKPDRLGQSESSEPLNFLRRTPAWLEQFKLECNDFSVEIAGVDVEISEFTRGVALQMDSWTVEYKCKRGESSYRPPPRRRSTSRNFGKNDTKSNISKPVPQTNNPTDGRKLAIHIRGMESYMVDSQDSWEQDPFLRVPHFDVGLSTGNNSEGPILHLSSFSKTLHFDYSLYRHYSVIVATQVLREAFGRISKSADTNTHVAPVRSKSSDDFLHSTDWGEMETTQSPINNAPELVEFISSDVKIQRIRIKARMPDDPPMMLEVHGLDMGQHRWGFPFLKAKNFRLYAESPKVRNCWARLLSLRHFRIDLREARKRSEGKVVEEKSIDLSADAIRLAIPHHLILYKVTDNITNTVKACQQMHHRFRTGTNEYILEKKPDGPKIIPRISLKTKALLLELEDDPFETQLGLIYRVGLSEQKKRLAREAAFDAKVKKMEERERRKSSETTRTTGEKDSQKVRGRSRTWRAEPQPSQRAFSPEVASRSRPRSLQPENRNMRCDTEGAGGPSENAMVSPDEAWEKLQEHNSLAWIKRIKLAKEHHRARMAETRESFWGHDDMPTDSDESERILGLPMRPALMAAFFNDVSIIIDKPSFPLTDLPKFLHRVGKGLPKDTLFALLVPFSIKVDFNECKVLLRDYPLPFIHVPHTKVGQSHRGYSWSLQSDFVLAEDFRGSTSMRHAQVNIVPPLKTADIRYGGFAIDVRRTVSPVKSYSDIYVSINTSYATRITWCTAYQPAIQDMMMVFETFTKPHVDPSERTGFWDKIRLVLHSQITLAWEGDGDVHLTLKGM
jgi:hypothetical protein